MDSPTGARSSAIFVHERDPSPSKSNLRSFLASKIHKEPDARTGEEGLLRSSASTPYLPLPPQHQRQPREEQRSHYPLSERETPNMKSSRLEDTRKRNKSVLSLKSLINGDKQDRGRERDTSPSRGSQHFSRNHVASSRGNTKKSKSSTNLSALFKRSQSKENLHLPPEAGREDHGRDSPHSPSRHRPGTQPSESRDSRQSNRHPTAEPVDARRRTMGPRELSSLHALYDPLGLSSNESQPIQVGRGPPPMSPQRSNAPPLDDAKLKQMARGSHVAALIDIFNNKGNASTPMTKDSPKDLSPQEVETAFEDLLESRNISHQMRDKIRSLDPGIKAELVKKDRIEEPPRPRTSADNSMDQSRSQSRRERGRSLFIHGAFSLSKEALSSQGTDSDKSRRRSRSRTAHSSKDTRHSSESKRPESSSGGKRRPLSIDISKPVSSLRSMRSSIGLSLGSNNGPVTPQEQPDEMADPGDFVHYLQEIQKPELVSTSRIHKLRILLRNETVAWVDEFITIGGLSEVIGLLYRILQVEWRGQHEDILLHETLLCLKGLSTTSLALQELCAVEDELFPTLLKMLFDEENKGPAEFTTRGIVITLLFAYLTDTILGDRASRARKIMSYIQDPMPPEEKQPLTFIATMHQRRPYRAWCKEVGGVTKEVFWIFLHPTNIIPLPSAEDLWMEERGRSCPFEKRFYPPPRAPAPAAPYVGGVEWDATVYMANHLQLMNGIIASLPTREERNQFRADLRSSGFEKVMGGSLRTCKEKFFGHLHEGLKLWVSAAREDGWPYMDVREGPAYPLPKNVHRRVEPPPRLDLPVHMK